jgi:hypothetical protein
MPVRVVSGGSANLPVGGVWEMTLAVTGLVEDGGLPADELPVVTVTLPGGGTDTPTAAEVCSGVYAVAYVIAAAGRHTARAVTATLGAADLTAYATAIVPASGMPALVDLVGNRGVPVGVEPVSFGYLGKTSFTDEQVEDALAAEAADQRGRCTVPAAYPADLAQALMRRVAVNLARRALPLGVLQGDAEAGSTSSFLPYRDPEVRRFESKYPRMIVG